MNLQTFVFNFFHVHTMVAWQDGRSDCVVVDPGDCEEAEHKKLYQYLDSHGLKPTAILVTHGHPDHIFGVQGLVERYGCTVYMSADDDKTLDFSADTARKLGMGLLRTDFPYTAVRDGESLGLAGIGFTVITTPGHSPGGLCWYAKKEGVLFSGDTLFRGTIGRTDYPGGSLNDEMRSIREKLLPLDPDTLVYPGHGLDTSIGYEKLTNPMLSDDYLM